MIWWWSFFKSRTSLQLPLYCLKVVNRRGGYGIPSSDYRFFRVSCPRDGNSLGRSGRLDIFCLSLDIVILLSRSVNCFASLFLLELTLVFGSFSVLTTLLDIELIFLRRSSRIFSAPQNTFLGSSVEVTITGAFLRDQLHIKTSSRPGQDIRRFNIGSYVTINIPHYPNWYLLAHPSTPHSIP